MTSTFAQLTSQRAGQGWIGRIGLFGLLLGLVLGMTQLTAPATHADGGPASKSRLVLTPDSVSIRCGQTVTIQVKVTGDAGRAIEKPAYANLPAQLMAFDRSAALVSVKPEESSFAPGTADGSFTVTGERPGDAEVMVYVLYHTKGQTHTMRKYVHVHVNCDEQTGVAPPPAPTTPPATPSDPPTKPAKVIGDANLTPTQIHLQTVEGHSADGQLTFTNDSNEAIKIIDIAVTPQVLSDSAASTLSAGESLAPGASGLVDIFFMPAITGEDQHYSGEVTIHYTRGDGTTGQLSVPVTADSTALPRPKLAVDLLNVDFGSVKLGLSKILTFTLTNTGNAPMAISPFTFGNGSTENNSPFAFPTYTQGTFTLQPGASEPINVIFRPYVAGPAQVAVTVTTDGGTQTVTLQGSGVAPTAPPSTSPPQPGCP